MGGPIQAWAPHKRKRGEAGARESGEERRAGSGRRRRLPTEALQADARVPGAIGPLTLQRGRGRGRPGGAVLGWSFWGHSGGACGEWARLGNLRRGPAKAEALRQASQEVGCPCATREQLRPQAVPGGDEGRPEPWGPGFGCSSRSAVGTGDIYEGARLGIHQVLDMLV